MKTKLKYGKQTIEINVPNDALVYGAAYEEPLGNAEEMLLASLNAPIGCESLHKKLAKRILGNVVIVVSDITRPIPYYSFLPQLIEYINAAGVAKEEIVLLVATGMHRPSTPEERIEMFGEDIASTIKIIDHEAEKDDELETLEGTSWSGAKVRLNKHYVNAGFRIVTGLVEPHFMAGFSGGRKAICPGLASLDAVQKFHGYDFLSDSKACNINLDRNPLHQENTSIARMCPAEYAIHVVLDQHKNLNAIFSGELFISHEKTVEYVKASCCPKVKSKADVVITSCGGYPLDTTFYQCVKGMVSCLPTIKQGGEVIAFGSCTEGIGSPEYVETMKKYSHKYKEFIKDIKCPNNFTKDQWQFQMHVRSLDKTGQEGLHFFTSAISTEELGELSVNPYSIEKEKIQDAIQKLVDQKIAQGKTIAVIPEGPYCAPINTM